MCGLKENIHYYNIILYLKNGTDTLAFIMQITKSKSLLGIIAGRHTQKTEWKKNSERAL